MGQSDKLEQMAKGFLKNLSACDEGHQKSFQRLMGPYEYVLTYGRSMQAPPLLAPDRRYVGVNWTSPLHNDARPYEGVLESPVAVENKSKMAFGTP